jgi:hypothetical protein
MNKALRFIEILWLGVAAVCSVEIYVNWGTDWQNTIKFSLILGAGLFMYFLRRRSRLKQTKK